MLTIYRQDRPWNDPGPRRGEKINLDDNRPILRAIILDFSAVNNVDVSSVQALVDIRNQLDRYAAPEVVDWHFANVSNRWTRRALASAGFGYQHSTSKRGNWKPVFTAAETELLNTSYSNQKTDIEHQVLEDSKEGIYEITPGRSNSLSEKGAKGETAALFGVNRPFFHVDIQSALDAVVINQGR
jgi:sodium-independent sulfate anion transporter 11